MPPRRPYARHGQRTGARALPQPAACFFRVTFVCAAASSKAPPQAQVCSRFGPEFYAQAQKDFEPFLSLSAWNAQRAKNMCRQQAVACFVVQISGGQVYIIEEQPGFQSRSKQTMAHLHRMAAKLGPLPDAEFVVDTSDGFSEIEAPVFVIAKFPNTAGGILYPDFSSYAWPESECPSEPTGSHVWGRAVEEVPASSPPWHEKDDGLFWRGAATSVYRRQVVPALAAISGANVSFIEWVVSREGRQTVRRGSCVPLVDWCRHKFLANLPGNTMALSLKYKLLCGSVVLSSPMWYSEWYYSQLQPGVHYVEVDALWTQAGDVLNALRSDETTAQAIAAASRAWALRHLTADAFDCYWRRLVDLAHAHFPPPRISREAAPLEHAMLAPLPSRRSPATELAAGTGEQVDVVILIPARAADSALMHHARRGWLSERTDVLSHQHFFVLSVADPGIRSGEANNDDVLIVDCLHGYTWLLQKMALAYRAILARFQVKFFVRADADSVLPLPALLALLPFAARGDAVSHTTDPAHACSKEQRWRHPVVGPLVCQTECALDRHCFSFAMDIAGVCTTYARCEANDPAMSASDLDGRLVYEYRLRLAARGEVESSHGEGAGFAGAPGASARPFVLGTILYGSKVIMNDTNYNPQWNNPQYTQDTGLDRYPPYPEASGYAMSASVAAFLAAVGEGNLTPLTWRFWAIEDASMGTVLAGLDITFLQLPVEIRQRIRVLRVGSGR